MSPSVVSASKATAADDTLGSAIDIVGDVQNPDFLCQFLGGLPLGKGHCANLAVKALKDALGKVRAEGSGE